MKAIRYSRDKLKKLLGMRLRDGMKYRNKKLEQQWRKCEQTIYDALGVMGSDNFGSNLSIDDLANYLDQQEPIGVGVNYAFKHFRFIHAQMSANPPSVIARPTSSDPADKRRADAADKLCRHGIRGYKMQETVDKASGKALMYGTGWIKTEFDKTKGDILSFDSETGDIEMEGDLNIYSPSTWDVWLDPHARSWEDVKWIIERKWLSLFDAQMMFPDYAEVFESISEEMQKETQRYADKDRDGLEENAIPIFYYYEPGLPCNGMAGRCIPFLDDGQPLTEDSPSPFRFPAPPETKEEVEAIINAEENGEKIDRGPETAYFPFHILTDIDVNDQVYGKSFIEYEIPIQDTLNRLDSVTLDNVQAHSVVRIVLPEGCEINTDSLTDTPYEIIKTTGNQKPHFVGVPSLMPETGTLRNTLQAGGDDVAGVNDAMFGKTQRETSGFSMQYATNQGNMIRRRLFNKYVLFVESIYKGYLGLIQKHWTSKKTIKVLGREKAYESIDIKGSDIISGFDLVVEYGASLSLDPTSRREEIIALMPIFEKYGVDGKSILSMLKLNELEGMYDMIELGAIRQQEIFEHIIAGKGHVYIRPRDKQDHESMLKYCYKFVMTSEYRDLDSDIRALIDKHIDEREEMKAGGILSMQGANAGSNPPGPAGGLGEMPDLGGMEQALMGEGAPLPSVGV